jgi:hypothetical protein
MSRQLVDAALAELSRAFAKLYARDGRPSIPPERADDAGFWTLDRTTIAGRSAVILAGFHTEP